MLSLDVWGSCQIVLKPAIPGESLVRVFRWFTDQRLILDRNSFTKGKCGWTTNIFINISLLQILLITAHSTALKEYVDNITTIVHSVVCSHICYQHLNPCKLINHITKIAKTGLSRSISTYRSNFSNKFPIELHYILICHWDICSIIKIIKGKYTFRCIQIFQISKTSPSGYAWEMAISDNPLSSDVSYNVQELGHHWFS